MAQSDKSAQFTPARGEGNPESTSSDIEQRWNELRSKIHNQWPSLSKSDLAMIDGDSRKLIALVHQKTGADISEIESKIDEIAATSEGLLGRVSRAVQSAASQATHAVSDPVAQAYHSVESQIAVAPVRSSGIAFGCGIVIGLCMASVMKDAQETKPQSMFDRFF